MNDTETEILPLALNAIEIEILLLALNDREGILATDWETANRKESHALADQIGRRMREVRALADKLKPGAV